MRKITMLLLILFNYAYGQDTGTPISLSKYMKDTRRIMDTLKINIRETLRRDGQLNIESYDSLGRATAVFHADYTFLDNEKKVFYYKNPIIMLTHKTAEILFENDADTTYARTIAESILIHEICHYLQSTIKRSGYTNNLDSISRVDYIKQPTEYEAYATDGFFLLERLEPEYLSFVMTMNVSIEEKRKMIILRSHNLIEGVILHF